MKTLIFDFDGVFVDSFQVSLEAFQTLHEKFGLPHITGSDLKNLFCNNLWEEHKKYGLPEEKERLFKSELLSLVGSRQDEISFFEGVPRVIKEIAEINWPLFIITSNRASSVKNKLASVDLDTAFTDISGADSPGNKEEKITNILKGLPEKETAFFVTDTVGDIKEVQGLAVKTLAVTWGFHSKKLLEEARPDFLLEEPREFLKIIKDENI